MRISKFLFIIMLQLSLVAMLACSKNGTDAGNGDGDGDGDPNSGNPGTVSMKIDGVDWTPAAVTGTIYIPNNAVGIVGSLGNLFSAFVIVISDVNGLNPGSYPLAANDTNPLGRYFTGGYSQAVGTDSTFTAEPNENNPQGTLVITEVNFTDQFISGTFSMDLISDEGTPRVIRITEGKFYRIPLTAGNAAGEN